MVVDDREEDCPRRASFEGERCCILPEGCIAAERVRVANTRLEMGRGQSGS